MTQRKDLLTKKYDMEFRLLKRDFMRQKSSNPLYGMKLIIQKYSLINTVVLDFI